jgi:HlyD family secretion protein
MRRVIVIVVLVGVFVAAAVPILGSAQANTTTNTQATAKQATVDKGEVQITVSATGKIVVKQQSNLSFDQSGQIKTVLVKEGDAVKAGQLLAQQEDSTQQSSLAQANDAVTAANASLQKLLSPVDPGEIAKAEANVKAAEASYSSKASSVNPDTVKSYQLQVDKANAAVIAANYATAGAGGQYATTDPNYQKSVAAAGIAWGNAQIAQLQLQQAQQGSSLLSATAQITYQQALLAQLKAGPTQEQIQAAQASVKTAELQRDQAQHNLDKTKLVAPFSGVITSIAAKAGEISSGMVMVLTDTSELGVDVNVDEADIGKVQVGQTVKLTLDAVSGAALTGKVQHIADTADTTASVITYIVHVVLDPTKAALKPGMTTNATFLVKDVKDVLRVPNAYLKTNRGTNQTTVTLVNRNGGTITVPVKVGVQGTDYSEVIEGLREGETITLITTTNAAAVNPGQ